MECPDKARWDEIMTRRYAKWVAFTLLLVSGCGDSPAPETPVAKPDPTSLAMIEYNKGVDFYDKEDWDTAIACCSEAIRLKPDYAVAYYVRGNAYKEKGDQAKADADFAKAKELEAT